MKSSAILLAFVFVLLAGCSNQNTSLIIGTWQLVDGKVITSDTTFTYPGNSNGNHWKIITKSHFATIYQDTTSNIILSTGFNGGTYTYIDGIYTEKFSHSSISNRQLGTSLYFKANVDGDKLFLSPCLEDGTEKATGNFEEYKRLD
jgi:hypothetical protein